MTQKQLRKIARQALGDMIKKGIVTDFNVMNAAIAALNAPDRKGE